MTPLGLLLPHCPHQGHPVSTQRVVSLQAIHVATIARGPLRVCKDRFWGLERLKGIITGSWYKLDCCSEEEWYHNISWEWEMEYLGNNFHEDCIEEEPRNDAAGIHDGKI